METAKPITHAIDYLVRNFNLTNVACLSWGKKASGFALFTGELESKRVFIKWGGKPGACRNDFLYTSRLHEQKPEFFPRIFFLS